MTESKNLIINFGDQPVSNRFQIDKTLEAPKFPLEIMLEQKYGSIKLVNPFPINELKPKFDWITCFEPENHLDELTNDIVKIINLKKNSKILGYSFKDETTLTRLKKKRFFKFIHIKPKRGFKNH